VSLRFCLFGHPVGHSLSPAIHGGAYRALGLPHRYELVDVPDEAVLATRVRAIREGAIRGANVTIPWKRAALRLSDEVDASAERVGAANVLSRTASGRVRASNTDVEGLAAELSALAPGARRVLVLGSGGAALAAVVAAHVVGARSVAVTARRFSADVPRETWPRAADFTALGSEVLPWPGASPNGESDPVAAFASAADIVVQATSAGMQGKDPGAVVADIVPWSALPSHAVAYDLVYTPPETEFMLRARERGLRAENGLGMLVEQAALALEIWLDVRAPRAEMRAAAEAELRARRAAG